MSAFYLLGLFGIWAVLTALIWKGWRRIRKEAAKPIGIDITFAVVALAWLAASFWYGGGRKYYYDAEVERLCAIDGGVKVYETVRLPAERFDKWGNVGIQSKQMAKPSDEYIYENETTYIRDGDPSLWRSYTTMLRRKDQKILGEAISYHRVGGDIPSPWHPSSFGCPKPIELKLEQAVFIREVTK